jgi:hypothetical protein
LTLSSWAFAAFVVIAFGVRNQALTQRAGTNAPLSNIEALLTVNFYRRMATP